uniref:Uncharacterized protein n=1 Tax=Anguilla anguilla TaxID=7936 RepID=A0A0E9TA08_ANGAN
MAAAQFLLGLRVGQLHLVHQLRALCWFLAALKPLLDVELFQLLVFLLLYQP